MGAKGGDGKFFYEDLYPIPNDLRPRMNEAVSFIRQGEYAKALEIASALLGEEPNHPIVICLTAGCYSDTGDDATAKQYLERCIEIAPDFPLCYVNLVHIYGRTNRMEEATKMADKVLELYPTEPYSWKVLGRYYWQIGEYNLALNYYLAAYNMNDADLVLAYNIGCMYTVNGKPEKALDYLEKAFEETRLYKAALTDPEVDPHRDDPRFVEMMDRYKKAHGILSDAEVEAK